MAYPAPHLDKLNATLENVKLPEGDRTRIEAAKKVYSKWIADLDAAMVEGLTPAQTLERMVELLNGYAFYVNVESIFDSPDDFLYRQKGQLKLDNSVIEEFLPWLINRQLIPDWGDVEQISVGPTTCFSAVYFESCLEAPAEDGGLRIRTKAQDFAISKRLYLRASHSPTFDQMITADTNLAYVVAECKTNLDKTMFQEACATAHDVKTAVPGAKYYLLCEWLDMPPVSTAPTDVDEVLLLRKAKRLGSGTRQAFSKYEGRQRWREYYARYLREHPFRVEVFQRLLDHIRYLLSSEGPEEKDVLETGYF